MSDWSFQERVSQGISARCRDAVSGTKAGLRKCVSRKNTTVTCGGSCVLLLKSSRAPVAASFAPPLQDWNNAGSQLHWIRLEWLEIMLFFFKLLWRDVVHVFLNNSYKSTIGFDLDFSFSFLLVIVAVVCISALYELSCLKYRDGFAALL